MSVQTDAHRDHELPPDEQGDALRAGTWALLGNLLAGAPDTEVLSLLRGIGSADEDGDAMAGAWQELRVAAEVAREEVLPQEYHDVFIGVGGGEITPYASYYVAGVLMDRPLIALRQELKNLGVERQEGICEPEDHAAAVCEAMALAIRDPEVSFDWQQDFYRQHVDPWMGRMFRDLESAPSATFYRAVGAFGAAFLDFERRYLAMAV